MRAFLLQRTAVLASVVMTWSSLGCPNQHGRTWGRPTKESMGIRLSPPTALPIGLLVVSFSGGFFSIAVWFKIYEDLLELILKLKKEPSSAELIADLRS